MNLQSNHLLKQLAQNFSVVGDVTVAIFDVEGNCITGSDKNNDFCLEVRKSSVLYEKCKECDRQGFLKCTSTKAAYTYRCHMGLLEITAPIFFGDTLLGFLIIGQFTNDPKKEDIIKAVKEVFKNKTKEVESLCKKVEKVTYLPKEKITALTQMLEMCASYIWLNNALRLNSSDLAYEIKLYITQHLEEDLSIATICSRFGMAPTTLYRLFKKVYGSSVIKTIQNERIERAKQLLKSDKLSVGEVAAQVGIPDQNYFSRLFKAITGITPLNYSKKNQ